MFFVLCCHSDRGSDLHIAPSYTFRHPHDLIEQIQSGEFPVEDYDAPVPKVE